MKSVLIAFVVSFGEEDRALSFGLDLKEIELATGVGVRALAVSDGPDSALLASNLQEAGLASQCLPPPAWGEIIGLENSEARLVNVMGSGDGFLVRLADLPSRAALQDALRRVNGSNPDPQDWDSSHLPLPPRISGFSYGLVHCALCQVLLRSERGPGVSKKIREACSGRPGSTR